MSLNLGNVAVSFLKENAGNRFTARQTSEYVVEAYPAECAAKMQRSECISTCNGINISDFGNSLFETVKTR